MKQNQEGWFKQVRGQKILMILVLCFAFIFTATAAFASLTFSSNSSGEIIDAGTGHSLSLQGTSNGNVGIGTTAPAYALDVAGDVNVTGNFKINGNNISTGSGGTPGGSNGQIQYNNNGALGGAAFVTTDGNNLIFPAASDRFLKWTPTNYLTQNGSWACRSQMQNNPFDSTRRDDAVKCGWNLDGEVPGMNSSSLTFESYYVTSVGIRQSETYFNVSDGLGHGHRPWAVYYDIDANVSTSVLSGDVFYFGNKENTGNGYFSVSNGIISTPYFSASAAGDTTELKTLGSTAAVDLVLRPKGNGNVSLQTSSINVSAPLITDGARLIKSGSFSGTTTKMATVSGTITAAHVASWDANGNLIDGGAGASGCTASGGNGAIQYDNGSGGCTGSGDAKFVNPYSLQLNNSSGSLAQLIIQTGGLESLRLQSASSSHAPRLAMADAFVSGALDVALSRSGAGAFEINNGTDGSIAGTKLAVGTTITRWQASGSTPAVSNTSSNSCGTTSATVAGNDNTGIVTVGATSGTDCTVTFTVAAPNRWQCAVNNETTANLARSIYVNTTHMRFVGTFAGGDVLSYICVPR